MRFVKCIFSKVFHVGKNFSCYFFTYSPFQCAINTFFALRIFPAKNKLFFYILYCIFCSFFITFYCINFVVFIKIFCKTNCRKVRYVSSTN